MVDVIVRDWLADQLAVVLPAGFHIERFQRIPDAIVGPTAILRQERFGRQVVDGRTIPGGRIVAYTLTLAVQYEDIGTAEAALDDDVVTLLDALDELGNVRWITAEKRILSETTQAPCYDIGIEVPYQHTKG